MAVTYEKVKEEKNWYIGEIDEYFEKKGKDRRLSDKLPHEEVLYPRPEDSQISSDSIDITPSEKIYEMECVMNRINNERIEKYGEEMNTDSEPILRPGHVYIIGTSEKLELAPDDLVATSDTRSTLARLGVSAQIVGRNKNAKLGIRDNGQMAIQVKPKQFPIKITPEDPDSSLVQLRFDLKYRDTNLTFSELIENYPSRIKLVRNEEEIEWKEAHDDNYLEENGVNLNAHTRFMYEAKDGIQEPIDITKENFYDPEDFFELIETDNDEVVLNSGKLYLVGTEESVELDHGLCGEVERSSRYFQRDVPIHEAGFVSNAWKGPLTLEIIPHTDVIFDPGYVGRMLVERIRHLDEEKSGEETSYIGQESPKLPKVFKG